MKMKSFSYRPKFMVITISLLTFLFSFDPISGDQSDPFLFRTKKSAQSPFPFLNLNLPLEHRAFDLVSRLTLEEKVGQLMNDAPAIERLGIPKYHWWNECLHGVARAGIYQGLTFWSPNINLFCDSRWGRGMET